MKPETLIGAAAAVLASPVPDVSAEDAEAAFRRLWGQDGTATPLHSERDRNFRVVTPAGDSFILKFTNANEDPDVTDFQTQALVHVGRSDPTLPVQRIVPTLDAVLIARVAGGDGRMLPVRLFTWLEGDLLAHRILRPQGLLSLGEALARVAQALSGFSHPAAETHPLLWDMQHAASLRPLLPLIPDDQARGWVSILLDRFEARVLPVLPQLPRGVIHNDLTGSNMLMDGETVAGILDFGDLVSAPVVQEIGVTGSYHLDLVEGADLFAPLLHLLTGYERVRPLSALEAGVLFDLIATRLALRALIPAWRTTLYPENRDYLMRNAGRAWQVMQRVAEMNPADGQARLLDLWQAARGRAKQETAS
ncbi:phosphotransferase [Acidisoma cellulosilytica]|uniref:Hydroxylysine kinase n=1 Tax=Acidisoma cellulosilyticum TaxID=2802395 RepID=A0A963YXV8_9PROT|nr:phosphotransferase [Acidisoma cellulosilyticum]MCB8879139.1 phosphotransferase [Acidisoma cellulosilyticum]